MEGKGIWHRGSAKAWLHKAEFSRLTSALTSSAAEGGAVVGWCDAGINASHAD
jgi:hypothetical protein